MQKLRATYPAIVALTLLFVVFGCGKPRDEAPTPDTSGQSLPKLLDLGAHACIPCKMMAPILDDLKANYAEHFETVFIDVWQNPAAGHRHGVRTIPTQIFFTADAKELFRHEGFMSKEDILGKWQELGYTFASPEKDATE